MSIDKTEQASKTEAKKKADEKDEDAFGATE